MPLTIPQALHWWFQNLGRRIHFSVTPPACERLMTQARAAGIPVGRLYIVSRPLSAGNFGTCDRETGDLCCYYEASRGIEGQRELLQRLLILLASLKLGHPMPHTVAQEWENIRQDIEEAYVLAQQWGQTDMFSSNDRTRLLEQATDLATCYRLAGLLAGNLSPWVARTAYAALQDRRCQFPTLATQEQFLKALSGTGPDGQINDAMVMFDRSLLRDRWVVTSTRSPGDEASFREFTVPLVPQTAHLLRAVLLQVAAWTTEEQAPVPSASCWFQDIADEMDLALLLRVVNAWLMQSHPQAAVRLFCRVYGDAASPGADSPHIYRLSLSYEDAPIDGMPTRDLWGLFAAPPVYKRRALEGAWQRFLLPWLTWSEVLCEPLAQGLRMLWMLQAGHP